MIIAFKMASASRFVWLLFVSVCYLSFISICEGNESSLVAQQHTRRDDDGLWVQKYIGDLNDWIFDGRGRGIASATATDDTNNENNVIACIDTETGKLNWRQVLPNNENKIETMLIDGNSVLTLSGTSIVRKWDIDDGSLIWETNNNNKNNLNNENKNDILIVGESNLALIDNNVLSMIYRFDGSVLWSSLVETDVTQKGSQVSKLLIDLSSETIYVLTYHIDANTFTIAALTLGTGKMMGSEKYELGGECGNVVKFDYFDSSLASHQYFNLVYLCENGNLGSFQIDKDSLLFKKHSVEGWYDNKKQHNSKENPINTMIKESNNQLRLVSFELISNHISTAQDFENESHDSRDLLLIFENSENKNKVTRLMRVQHFSGNESLNMKEKTPSKAENTVYCNNQDNAVLSVTSGKATLQVTSEVSGESTTYVLDEKNFDQFATNHGKIIDCYFDNSNSNTNANANILVKTQDSSLNYFESNSGQQQQLRLVWEREESLASPLFVYMFDMFTEDSECENEEECEQVYHRSFPSFFKRLRNDLSSKAISNGVDWLLDKFDLIYLLRTMNFGDYLQFVPFLQQYAPDGGSGGWSEDIDSKVVTILTKHGKLYGIDSDNGNIRWTLVINKENNNNYEIVRMLSVRQHPSQLLIVLTSELLNNTKLISVQAPFHGPNPPSIHETVINDAVIRNAILTNVLNEEQIKLVLLPIYGTDRVLTWPETPQSSKKSKVLKPDYPIYYYNINFRDDSQCVTGYSIVYNKETQSFEQRIVWNKSFLHSSETLLTASMTNQNEIIINSIYRTGELGAIFKYLNPHMFGIATYDYSEKILHVYLIDGITGLVYEHNYHRYASPSPVSLLCYENKVVYTFWDELKQVTQIITLDLWLSDPLNIPKEARTAAEGWLVPENPLDSNEFSVFNAPLPVITSQAYNFGLTINKLLGVSNTKFNVCNRVILAKTQGNSLIKMDSRLLNTRRPLVADHSITPANREERVMPYKRFLPFQTLNILSKDIALPGLNGILSVGGAVESQSLIFGFGLDLVKCKITASRTSFDVIDPNLFDLKMLFAILVVIVAAIYGAKYFAQRKKLRKQWE